MWDKLRCSFLLKIHTSVRGWLQTHWLFGRLAGLLKRMYCMWMQECRRNILRKEECQSLWGHNSRIPVREILGRTHRTLLPETSGEQKPLVKATLATIQARLYSWTLGDLSPKCVTMMWYHRPQELHEELSRRWHYKHLFSSLSETLQTYVKYIDCKFKKTNLLIAPKIRRAQGILYMKSSFPVPRYRLQERPTCDSQGTNTKSKAELFETGLLTGSAYPDLVLPEWVNVGVMRIFSKFSFEKKFWFLQEIEKPAS